MSRRSDLPSLVDGLDGSDQAKERLRAIARVAAGECTLEEAAAEIGLSPQRFSLLRERVLQASLLALEPKPPGRPKTVTSEAEDEIAELKARINLLEVAREGEILRREYAMLFGDRGLDGKKNA